MNLLPSWYPQDQQRGGTRATSQPGIFYEPGTSSQIKNG
uniref:Uncharacterized protein n=1 Tax=Utricularia reniformis TaxID=192314 RepID=A0A1Y0AZ76_9LAMI|nr:hypothetical protein AEK19_MT0185 [Utricularia reniformis]ART30467.1 hypothetical protein AEK19_MT0185 [Utricularia reniformis]